MQIRPTPIVPSATPSARIVGLSSEAASTETVPAGEPMLIDLPNSDAAVEVRAGELPKIVEQMNKAVQVFTNTIHFEVHESHRIFIRVIDTTTGEIVREIPPEKLLESFNRLEDLVGLLMDLKF